MHLCRQITSSVSLLQCRRLITALVVALLVAGPLLPSMNQAGAVQQTPTIYYTALGDSIASGHGLQPESKGDKYEGEDCRLSALSYPVKVGAQLGQAFGQELFPLNLACSGAGIGLGENKDFENQVELAEADIESIPDESPILITISIGANNFLRDNNARDFALTLGKEEFYTWVDAEIGFIQVALGQMLERLLIHPNVSVVMVTYPSPVPQEWKASCTDISSYAPDCLGGPGTAAPKFDYFIHRLNNVVGNEMYQKFSYTGRIEFTRDLTEEFNGHDCLSQDSWFQRVKVPVVSSSAFHTQETIDLIMSPQGDCVHPSDTGAQEIANEVATYAEPLMRAALERQSQELPTGDSTTGQTIDLAIHSLSCANGGNCWNESGARFTVTTETGEDLGSCTLEGVRDPTQQFTGLHVACVVPVPVNSTVIVTQDNSTITPGYAPIENPIRFSVGVEPDPNVTYNHWGVFFNNKPIDQSDGSAETPVSSDLVTMDIGAIGPDGHEIGAQFTVTTMEGAPLGSCTLEGHRDEPYAISCQVEVPRNTTVIVTLDESTITPGYAPIENPLYFDTSGDPGAASSWGVSFQIEAQGGTTNTSNTSDVAIETFLDGSPFYDACYVLVDFSNEGCDRNQDGKITYEDVPVGTYTVRQTADLPSGYAVQDFTINVTGNMQSGWETFTAQVVAGAADTPANIEPSDQSGAVDIALITREPENGDLLTGTCYVVGQSNEGCDENGDGQVTFADIPFGTYTVRQTQAPAGYSAINDYEITVTGTGYMEGPSVGVQLGFIVKQAPEQNAPNTRNVSVVFLDMVTHERVIPGACVELIGASNVGCDRDLVDGQADFLDVPAGGPYELSFSNLPDGFEVAEVGGPLAVTVPAGPGDPANVMVFVLLAGSDGGGSTIQSPSDQTSSGEVIEYFTVGCDVWEACLNATVTVQSQDGQFISSCTFPDTMEVDPWWCVAPDVPRGITVVLTVDGLAPGYEVAGDAVTWDTSVEPDQYTVGIPTISIVPASGDSTINSSDSENAGQATLLITFRACPEGFDPDTGDFYADCTIPLDAPDASFIEWGGDGQGGMNITGLDRQFNGEYVYNAGPGTMNVELSGMAPVVRNGYQVFGADSGDGSTFTVNLVDGETREVFVFYYYQ